MISDEQIKQIFVAHGFKLSNETGDDLKPYVYDAARALIKAIEQPHKQQIAQLREALHRIGLPRKNIAYCRDGHEEAVLVARKALEGKP